MEELVRQAIAPLAEANPRALAARAGASYDDGKFRLPFLNRQLAVAFPEGGVTDDRGRDVPDQLRLIVLHYLLNAKGVAPADMWVAFRDLPGANRFGTPFPDLEILANLFGRDADGFGRACLAMGGMRMDRTGDVAFRFAILPKIIVACILYLADEEFPATLNLVFDARCHLHLSLDDIKALVDYLLIMLKRGAPAPNATP